MDIQNKNIILCGFMGCGKSTVGKQLAAAMGRTFVDMDIYIEQQEGRSIKTIFAQEGEVYFRAREAEAVAALAQHGGLVIAAGGGTLLKEENVCTAKQNGVIIMLDAPLPAIKERLKGDTTRPLLQKENLQDEIDRIYSERIDKYLAAADLVVPADTPVRTVAQKVLEKINAL